MSKQEESQKKTYQAPALVIIDVARETQKGKANLQNESSGSGRTS